MLGSEVHFYDYTDDGREIVVKGIVEAVFFDPDDYQDSFRVRMADGTCRTPYYNDCWKVK